MATHQDTSYDSTRLEPLLTISQVGDVLAISRETVYRLIRAGDLEPIRVGARARFEPAEIRAYLDRQRQEAGVA